MRSVGSSRPVRRRGQEQKSWALKFYILLYLLITVSVFFGAVNYRIDLKSKIDNLRRAGNRAQQDIYEMERDIKALTVKRNQLTSWENVSSNIARYNLPFRASDPRQVRYFTVKRSNFRQNASALEAGSRQVMLSQNQH